jgi:integrase
VNTKNNRTGKAQTIVSWKAKVSKLVIAGYKAIGIYEKNRTELHSFRHSFGCRMYMITGNKKEVARMMNHDDENSTEKYIGYVEDVIEDFPSDAPQSAFKDSLARVAKANKKTLKYLMKSNNN